MQRLRWVGVWALLASNALAEEKVALIAEKLQYPPAPGKADDFRVRTSAALALGASGDEAAVGPLCRALDDPNETVRVASGAALKKLGKPSAVGCVRVKLASETAVAAKTQLQETLLSLSGGGEFTPRFVPDAKYYVALKIENKTTRPLAEVEKVALKALRQKFDAMNFQLAPAQEDLTKAGKVVKDRKLKGYFLSVTIDPFEYGPSGLKAKLRAAILTYPGKDLKGEVPANAAMPGVTNTSKSSEDALIEALAANIAQRFADNFH